MDWCYILNGPWKCFGEEIIIVLANREEKLLRHVGMVAKFLDDTKPKTKSEKWSCTVSNFIELTQFHLICQMLGKFSGVKSERTVSNFRQRKRKLLCCVFTPSFKPVREIRRFHVAVVQRKLRNVLKSVMHVQSCCFFSRSRCRRRRRCLSSLLLWSRNFATIVTWRHTSPLYYRRNPGSCPKTLVRKLEMANYNPGNFDAYFTYHDCGPYHPACL